MKSIIFNQHQVNYALKNKEGMFRVVIKPQPNSSINPVYLKEIDSWQWATKESRRKPKFEVGETIFVKEAFNIFCGQVAYKTTITGNERYFWMPASHMKQEHSRLTLRIKSVKVERLQDITPFDCAKEGIPHTRWQANGQVYGIDMPITQAFGKLWNSTHKKPEEKWEASPWVWCFNCEVIKNN